MKLATEMDENHGYSVSKLTPRDGGHQYVLRVGRNTSLPHLSALAVLLLR